MSPPRTPSSHTCRTWTRRVLLTCAFLGMAAAAFWDELEAFLHQHHAHGASGGDAESCPYIQLTSQPGSNVIPNADGSTHDSMASLDSLPPLEQVLPRNALPAMCVEELSRYDGSNPILPLLIAIDGYVVNVSSSENVYGSGGAYSKLAGHAATRAIALSSLQESDLTDDLHDFDDAQMEQKEKWTTFFVHKYPVVATLEYEFAPVSRVEKIREILRASDDVDTFVGLQKAVEFELRSALQTVLQDDDSVPTLSVDQIDAIGMPFVIVDGWAFDVSTDAMDWWYGQHGSRSALVGTDVTSKAIAMDAEEVRRVSKTWQDDKKDKESKRSSEVDVVDMLGVVRQWALVAYLRSAPVLARVSLVVASDSSRDEL